MVPQAKKLNEALWRSLEGHVRKMAAKDGEIYIVTGPVFKETDRQLNGRVTVPSLTFKAIYDPKLGGGAVYLATNVNATVCKVMTIGKLRTMIGFNPFPGASSLKAIPLPLPRKARGRPGSCS